MRFPSFIALWLTLGCLLCLEGCKHPIGDPVDQVDPDDGDGGGDGGGQLSCEPGTVYFEQQVLPILIANCARSGCHNAASAQEGVVLTSYDQVMATADIRANDPEGSDFYEAITEDDHDDRMPPAPNPPLQPAQIELIAQWINQGAKNLSCDDSGTACNTENISFANHVLPLLQNRCIGCHSAANSSGGVNLSAHAGVTAAASGGRLVGVINHAQGFLPMPQGGQKLSQCDIDKITAWVQAGTPNN